MPVDERTRRIMTEGLVRFLGEEVTDALLAHLPPAGWGEVATVSTVEQGLEQLGDRLRAEFQRELRTAVSEQTRTLVWAQIGTSLTVAVIAFSAARLV